MKLYRYYTAKKDHNILKDHVWFLTNVHDAAYHASKGVVLEYDIDEKQLKMVNEEGMKIVDEYDSLPFPNQELLQCFRKMGFNSYTYKWEDYGDISILIFDTSLIPEPKILTNENVFVKYQSFRREVNNEVYAVFGPLSLYDRWVKSGRRVPNLDDTYDGYVEDEIFFNATQKQFEDYVREHFKYSLYAQKD